MKCQRTGYEHHSKKQPSEETTVTRTACTVTSTACRIRQDKNIAKKTKSWNGTGDMNKQMQKDAII